MKFFIAYDENIKMTEGMKIAISQANYRIVGWGLMFKIRMFRSSMLPIPLYVYKKIYYMMDKKTKDEILSEAHKNYTSIMFEINQRVDFQIKAENNSYVDEKIYKAKTEETNRMISEEDKIFDVYFHCQRSHYYSSEGELKHTSFKVLDFIVKDKNKEIYNKKNYEVKVLEDVELEVDEFGIVKTVDKDFNDDEEFDYEKHTPLNKQIEEKNRYYKFMSTKKEDKRFLFSDYEMFTKTPLELKQILEDGRSYTLRRK